MKAARRIGVALLSLVAAYLLAAVIGALWPGRVSDVAATGADRDIRLIAGPIHYDFLLPLTPEVIATFSFVEEAGVPIRHPEARWLSVGWGSEAFYTQTGTYADLSLPVIWRAATGDSSVLRFEVLGTLPEHPAIRPITLDTAQFGALVAELADATGPQPRALDAEGHSATDAFYAAEGRFDLFRTCNTWVADRLRAAGLPMGVWTPTPYAVTLSLRWFDHL